LLPVVSDQESYAEHDNQVNGKEQKFKDENSGEVLVQQLGILGNIPVIEIGDTEIKKETEQKREIQD